MYICACNATVTVSWFWCMTTRHGFVHNINKKKRVLNTKILKRREEKTALENNTTRWIWRQKKPNTHKEQPNCNTLKVKHENFFLHVSHRWLDTRWWWREMNEYIKYTSFSNFYAFFSLSLFCNSESAVDFLKLSIIIINKAREVLDAKMVQWISTFFCCFLQWWHNTEWLQFRFDFLGIIRIFFQ